MSYVLTTLQSNSGFCSNNSHLELFPFVGITKKQLRPHNPASLMTQLVKNPPAMWKTWVQSLGREDPLEKGKATHSIFWPGESNGLYSPWGHKESNTTK